MKSHLPVPKEDPSFFPSNMMIASLDPDVYFVFGSNIEGRHGTGAALGARLFFGAKYGVGEGVTGRAYALPTLYRPYWPLPLEHIEKNVQKFREFVESHPNLYFAVTAIGTRRAGYEDKDIAPMFKGIPRCWFPECWRPYLT